MREQRIDADTVIGFDYVNQYYYVTNKDYTTNRVVADYKEHPLEEAAIEIKKVLDIVAPDNQITVDDLITLATRIEQVTELFYTWDDTGSYIRTIQFNDYENYPFTIDCEKSVIYIMNTEIIFDLKQWAESRRRRIEAMQSFYYNTLGLNVSTEYFDTLYELLVSYYRGDTCINLIQPIGEDETEYIPTYSNQIAHTNYRGDSLTTYTCTFNPNGSYTPSIEPLGYITHIQDNTLTLTEPNLTIQPNDILAVTDTTYQIGTTQYSADGYYTVATISGSTISMTEYFPVPYSYEPPILEITAFKSYIHKISREDSSITLTNSTQLSNYLIGDTIRIENAVLNTGYEPITLSGTYTIASISASNHVIYTEETPATDYEPPTNTAYIYKPVQTAYIKEATGNTLTLASTPLYTLSPNTSICLNDNNSLQYSTISSTTSATQYTMSSTVSGTITATYGKLSTITPNTETLLNITESKYPTILPTGEFMLDNQQETIDYLKLINKGEETDPKKVRNIVPSNEPLQPDTNNIGNFNLIHKEVPTTYYTGLKKANNEDLNMQLKGLYSKEYPQQEA